MQMTKTKVTAERAKEILGKLGFMDANTPKHMSEGEIAFVTIVWRRMPGSYSFNDTLRFIAKGKNNARKPVCPYCESASISVQATAYRNDATGDFEVQKTEDEAKCESCGKAFAVGEADYVDVE